MIVHLYLACTHSSHAHVSSPLHLSLSLCVFDLGLLACFLSLRIELFEVVLFICWSFLLSSLLFSGF
ncbi:hypothetical protein QYF36_017263 [Acer negundo]|nr:hypothetical protein QYF36_017263 [Acer negundo]